MEHPFLAAKPPTHQPVVAEVQTAPHRITIKEAAEAFLEDEEGRQLRKGTTGQSKTLLQQQLIPWVYKQGLRYLDQLTVSLLARFRAYWRKDLENCQNTARRKHERLCGFFHLCIQNGKETSDGMCRIPILMSFVAWYPLSKNRNFLPTTIPQTAFVAESFGSYL